MRKCQKCGHRILAKTGRQTVCVSCVRVPYCRDCGVYCEDKVMHFCFSCALKRDPVVWIHYLFPGRRPPAEELADRERYYALLAEECQPLVPYRGEVSA